MKHLTILVPEGENNLSSIVGAYKIFSRANEHWQQRGRKGIFKIELAGVSKQVELHNGLFTIKPHTNISSINHTNLIIIPSLNHNYQKAVKGNKTMIDWIEKQYSKVLMWPVFARAHLCLPQQVCWMAKAALLIGL